MTATPIRLLMVEDDADYADFFRHAISAIPGERFEFEWAGTLDAGIAKVDEHDFDLVVLDLQLPDSRGLDTFARMHAHAPEIPILIHTGTDDEAIAVTAVRAGAQDYLVKGRAGSVALARVIRYSLERHRTQVELWNQSLVDELTKLYNRRGLLAMAAQQQRIARRTGRRFALFFADLDGLKSINDSHGHAEGDRALKCAAEALRQSFRDSDIVARLGGDEFVVLALDTAESGTEPLYQRLQENLKKLAIAEGLTYSLSFSVGVVRAEPGGTATIEQLLRQADEAMYRDKGGRRRAD